MPYVFTDTTRTRYGVVSSWVWNFGDPTGGNNIATMQIASHQYATAGSAVVTLIAGSDKGCLDTVSKTIVINDKPQIHLPFTDTLIYSGDQLPPSAQTTGTSFNWSPLYHINSPATTNPTVYPDDATVYTVTVRENACVESARVTVNVLDYITVAFAGDTAMCATDTITLRPVSDALSYLWAQSGTANTLSSTSMKYPKASPLQTTIYNVSANLGHCQATAQTTVYADATSFLWSPVTGLNNTYIYNPKAVINGAIDSVHYTVTATTPEGCTGRDSITVKVFTTLPGFFISSVFTPNGDGLNDVFKPIVAGIAAFRYFRVFNR